MSLQVKTTKGSIEVTTAGANDELIRIGEHERGMDHFRALVVWVMCNSNISTPNDQRLELLEDIRCLTLFQDTAGQRLAGLRPLVRNFCSRRGGEI